MGDNGLKEGNGQWEKGILGMYGIGLLTLLIIGLSAFLLLGPALTAFFYAMDKVIVHGHGPLYKNYWKSFKLNLKMGFFISLLVIVGSGLVFYIHSYMAAQGTSKILTGLMYVGGIELILVTLYSTVILAKFDLNFQDLMLRAIILGHKHILITLVVAVVIGLNVVAFIYIHPVASLVTVGVSGYVISRLILEKIMVHYAEPGALVRFDTEG